MSAWPFVAAAYLVTLIGTAALTLASWRSMRRAERPPADAREP